MTAYFIYKLQLIISESSRSPELIGKKMVSAVPDLLFSVPIASLGIVKADSMVVVVAAATYMWCPWDVLTLQGCIYQWLLDILYSANQSSKETGSTMIETKSPLFLRGTFKKGGACYAEGKPKEAKMIFLLVIENCNNTMKH